MWVITGLLQLSAVTLFFLYLSLHVSGIQIKKTHEPSLILLVERKSTLYIPPLELPPSHYKYPVRATALPISCPTSYQCREAGQPRVHRWQLPGWRTCVVHQGLNWYPHCTEDWILAGSFLSSSGLSVMCRICLWPSWRFVKSPMSFQ